MPELLEQRGRHMGARRRVAVRFAAVFLVLSAVGGAFPSGAANPPFFTADFESGGLEVFVDVQAEADRVTIDHDTASAGEHSARFEVRPGDYVAEGNRAEVTGPSFEEGQTVWFRQAIRLDDESPLDGEWQQVVQYSVNGEGPPALALFTHGPEDDGRFRLVLSSGNSSVDYWRSPTLERDEWHDVGVMVRFSSTDSGRVRVFLEDEPQTLENDDEEMGGTTFEYGRAYYKTGVYRSPTFDETTVVHHDGIMMGTTAEAVGLEP